MNVSETSDRVIWMDGEFVPWHEATVHVLSQSLQRGTLVFDYLSVRDVAGRGAAIFRLSEHVSRFRRSCELVGLPLRLSADELTVAAVETARKNPGATSMKMNAYLPSIEVDVVPRDDHVAVAIAAYDQARDMGQKGPGESDRSTGLKMWIEKEKRNRRDDIVSPQAKVAANYASPMLAKWRAREDGYDDVLLLDDAGFVAEAPTANFFIVDETGSLRTAPEEKILHGITRASVVDVAHALGIPVIVESITRDAVFSATEAFLAGTNAEVLPVASIDGVDIGGSVPGKITHTLRERFDGILLGRDAQFEHWLTFVNEG